MKVLLLIIFKVFSLCHAEDLSYNLSKIEAFFLGKTSLSLNEVYEISQNPFYRFKFRESFSEKGLSDESYKIFVKNFAVKGDDSPISFKVFTENIKYKDSFAAYFGLISLSYMQKFSDSLSKESSPCSDEVKAIEGRIRPGRFSRPLVIDAPPPPSLTGDTSCMIPEDQLPDMVFDFSIFPKAYAGVFGAKVSTEEGLVQNLKEEQAENCDKLSSSRLASEAEDIGSKKNASDADVARLLSIYKTAKENFKVIVSQRRSKLSKVAKGSPEAKKILKEIATAEAKMDKLRAVGLGAINKASKGGEREFSKEVKKGVAALENEHLKKGYDIEDAAVEKMAGGASKEFQLSEAEINATKVEIKVNEMKHKALTGKYYINDIHYDESGSRKVVKSSEVMKRDAAMESDVSSSTLDLKGLSSDEIDTAVKIELEARGIDLRKDSKEFRQVSRSIKEAAKLGHGVVNTDIILGDKRDRQASRIGEKKAVTDQEKIWAQNYYTDRIADLKKKIAENKEKIRHKKDLLEKASTEKIANNIKKDLDALQQKSSRLEQGKKSHERRFQNLNAKKTTNRRLTGGVGGSSRSFNRWDLGGGGRSYSSSRGSSAGGSGFGSTWASSKGPEKILEEVEAPMDVKKARETSTRKSAVDDVASPSKKAVKGTSSKGNKKKEESEGPGRSIASVRKGGSSPSLEDVGCEIEGSFEQMYGKGKVCFRVSPVLPRLGEDGGAKLHILSEDSKGPCRIELFKKINEKLKSNRCKLEMSSNDYKGPVYVSSYREGDEQGDVFGGECGELRDYVGHVVKYLEKETRVYPKLVVQRTAKKFEDIFVSEITPYFYKYKSKDDEEKLSFGFFLKRKDFKGRPNVLWKYAMILEDLDLEMPSVCQ